MDHFYNTTEGESWFDYEDLYKEVVARFPTGAHFVEVGTWKGRSACYMAVEIINSGKRIKFDCVDTWAFVPTQKDLTFDLYGDLYTTFLKNINPVKEYVTPVRAVSWEAANYYADKSLDFVFIDAAHDYESVSKDIAAWYPKIKDGGALGGHDYNPHAGVFNAVNDFFKDKHEVTKKGPCWFVEIGNPVTFDSYKDVKGYIINLDRERWRYGLTHSNLSRLGFSNLTRWKAADYREEDVNEEFRRMGATKLERFTSDGEIATVLSHYRVWLNFLAGSDPYCLVFEDDVVAGENFKQTADFADLHYGNFELLSFGGILLDLLHPSFEQHPDDGRRGAILHLDELKAFQDGLSYFKNCTFNQTHAYLLSRKGAYKAVNNYLACLNSQQYSYPQIDHYLTRSSGIDIAISSNTNIPDKERYRLTGEQWGPYGPAAARICGILYQGANFPSTVQNY